MKRFLFATGEYAFWTNSFLFYYSFKTISLLKVAWNSGKTFIMDVMESNQQNFAFDKCEKLCYFVYYVS